MRLDGGTFEIHVDSRRTADVLAAAATSVWLAFDLTLTDGSTVMARVRISGLSDAIGRWLQSCSGPSPATIVTERTSASVPAAISPALMIRSDMSTESGLVRWRVSPPDVATGTPVLIANFDVPASGLHLDLSIARSPDPPAGAAFLIDERFSARGDADVRPVMSTASPDFRSADREKGAAVSGVVTPGDADSFSIAVDRDLGDAFLSGLQDRAWLALPAVMNDGRTFTILLPLGDAGRATIDAWLHDCCGVAGASVTRASDPAAPATRAPALPGSQEAR